MPTFKPVPFSIKRAVAEHLGLDLQEVTKHRYQSTRTPCPVYAFEAGYFTATSSARPPKGNADYNWVKLDSWTTKAFGWYIWEHKED